MANTTPIRFEQLPIVSGPLSHFEEARPTILKDVVQRTLDDFSSTPTEMIRNADSPGRWRAALSNCAPRRVSSGWASAMDEDFGALNLAGTDEQAPNKRAMLTARITRVGAKNR